MYTERTTAAAAAARDGTARDMTARSDAACRGMDGSLPGGCGNMVFPYIAMQRENAQRYDNREALLQGTLFPGLDLPFRKELRSRFPQVNEALLELKDPKYNDKDEFTPIVEQYFGYNASNFSYIPADK